MEDIVIFAKKTKLAGMAIGCLVFEAFFIHFFITVYPKLRRRLSHSCPPPLLSALLCAVLS